jgi:hypothetical protein
MISYNIEPPDITALTWPMWEACGIECPSMIGAPCPADVGDGSYRRCPGWSAKFTGAAAEVVHGWTLDSGQSDECGDAECSIGWNALFRNPDQGTFDGPMGAGVTLTTDSQGFVSVTRYETAEERDADWTALQEEEAKIDRHNCHLCSEGQYCAEHDDDGMSCHPDSTHPF